MVDTINDKLEIIENPLREIHYDRNTLNTNLPSSPKQAEISGWEKLDDNEAYFHQLGEGNLGNEKWISPDGHTEVVFDSNGNIVTDPLNQGTYNIVGPGNVVEDIAHGILDVAPYIIWGNSEEDPSTILDRTMWTIDAAQEQPKEDSLRNQTFNNVVQQKLGNVLEME